MLPLPARVASPGGTVGVRAAHCTQSEAGHKMLELRPQQGRGPSRLHWALEELLITYGWEARLPFPGPHIKPPAWPKGLLPVISEDREPGGELPWGLHREE